MFLMSLWTRLSSSSAPLFVFFPALFLGVEEKKKNLCKFAQDFKLFNQPRFTASLGGKQAGRHKMESVNITEYKAVKKKTDHVFNIAPF